MADATRLNCPNCGAGLPKSGGASEVRCKFCGSVSTVRAPPTVGPPQRAPWMVPPRIPFFHVPAPQQVPRTERLTSQQLRIFAIVWGLMVLTGVVGTAADWATSHVRRGNERKGDDSSSSSPEEATEPEPDRPSFSFEDGTRPVIADLNGDATADYVIRTSTEILAIDGRTKKRAWSDTQKMRPIDTRLVRADDHLVAVDGRDVLVYSLRDGSLPFTTMLDAKSSRICRAAPPLARVRLKGGSVAAIDTTTGSVTTEPKGAPCEDADTDGPVEADFEQQRRPVAFLPPSLHALGCGVTTLAGTHTVDLPDRCSPVGITDAALVTMRPSVAIPVSGGHLVIGRERRGRPDRSVGLFANGRLVWKSTLADEGAEQVADPVAAFDGASLAIASPRGRAHVLVVFDAKTGARGPEAALPERALTVTPSGDRRWLVVGASSFVRVDDKGVVENLLDE